MSDVAPPSFVLSPEVAGVLGTDSQLDSSVHPPRVHRLHYEFDGPPSDDLVESFPCFVVSRQLGSALVAHGVSGFSLAPVHVTANEQLTVLGVAFAPRDDDWRWLQVTGHPGVDDLWVDDVARLHVTARALAVLRTWNLGACEVRPD